MTEAFDIIVVADPRFSGGTASALLADVDAFRALGAKVGVFFVTSGFFQNSRDKPNSAVTDLTDLDGVSLIANGASVTTELVFFHHPLAFAHTIPERLNVTAKRAVLVAHHPAFRGDGSLEYNPLQVNRRIAQSFGLRPWWAPVSGLVRQQLRSFSPLLRMTRNDWMNMFDPSDWQITRRAFDGPRYVVGRHSRPDRLKWPDTARGVADSLAADPEWHVRVMGWPLDGFPFDVPHSVDWDILDFNAVPVPDFVNSIDVFAYHFSDMWVEAFGRTIIEAMLLERPCLLDPRLERTFGKLATYCEPQDVKQRLDQWRHDTPAALAAARISRTQVIETYSSDAMAGRLDALKCDTGTISRDGPKTATPSTTLRKALGLARRSRG